MYDATHLLRARAQEFLATLLDKLHEDLNQGIRLPTSKSGTSLLSLSSTSTSASTEEGGDDVKLPSSTGRDTAVVPPPEGFVRPPLPPSPPVDDDTDGVDERKTDDMPPPQFPGYIPRKASLVSLVVIGFTLLIVLIVLLGCDVLSCAGVYIRCGRVGVTPRPERKRCR